MALTNDKDGDGKVSLDGLDVTGVETDGTIEYSLDGGKTWSKTAPDKLDNGTYTVDVRVNDVAGNVSDKASITFTVVKTVPSGPDNPHITNDSGSSSSDGITNEIPTIAADNLPTGSKLQFQVDGTTTWVTTLPTDLKDGKYTIHVRVVADTGAASTKLEDLVFTLDRTAPTALTATLSNGTGTGTVSSRRHTQVRLYRTREQSRGRIFDRRRQDLGHHRQSRRPGERHPHHRVPPIGPCRQHFQGVEWHHVFARRHRQRHGRCRRRRCADRRQ